MDIRLLDLESACDTEKYQNFLKGFDSSLFCSSVDFFDFLQHVIGHRIAPAYLVAEQDGDIVGVLPSVYVDGEYGPVLNSMPWYGSNPGAISKDRAVSSLLLREFYMLAKRLDCISATYISSPFDRHDLSFTRSDNDGFPDMVVLPVGTEMCISRRIGMVTELPQYRNSNYESLLMNEFHSKTRNQIRNSMQNCDVKEIYDKEAFDFIKKVHKQNMKAVGAPVKDKEFEAIKRFSGKYSLRVSYSKASGEPVAALMLKYFNKTVDYMIPAIVSTYRHLNPLHTLIFDAMVDAASKGYKYWNWGGTMPSGMEGVYHFKKRFGATETEYRYYTAVFYNPLFKFGKDKLLKEYPFFYVIPFEMLETEDDRT